jgi:predicted phage terminase large subunit-like protein
MSARADRARVELARRRARSELCRRSFRHFVQAAWPAIEPTRPLLPSVALDAICAVLQEAAERGGRWAISTPPGTSKSLLASVAWPAWLLLRSGGQARVMAASYSWDLAAKDSVRCRALITSAWYRGLVDGEWALRDDAARRDDFWSTTGGRRLVASVGGKTTGERCTVQIVDDALSAADAMSDAARSEAARWVTEVLPSRLEDPERDTRVIIGQRLHSADPIGVVLEQGGWRHLVLPALLDEGAPRCELRRDDGSLIWRDERAPGEPLVSLLSPAALARLKVELGSAAFSAQYMQNPVDLEGGMLRREWWGWWRPDGAVGNPRRPTGCNDKPAVVRPATFDAIAIAVDAAFKNTGDDVAFVVVGTKGARRFVLEVVARRMDFVETCAKLRELAARYPTARILVEEAANGAAIINALKATVPRIVPVTPLGGKESRAAAASPQVEAGDVLLEDGAPWVEPLVEQCAAFPRAKHDDIVDALVHALNHGGMSREARRASLLFGVA